MSRTAIGTLALALATAGAGAAFAAFLSTSWLVEVLERHATRQDLQFSMTHVLARAHVHALLAQDFE